jgi:hypothetical protein
MTATNLPQGSDHSKVYTLQQIPAIDDEKNPTDGF